ncbi:MAG: hypothetical protein HC921_21960 [Synechococcaceae cyanobacterium SM2_3_1]|nr:hypothetical protein [Synechococcaceae cyanobacterium SM2_3_1]
MESIRAALLVQPGLQEDESVRGWVAEWNLRFADVLEMIDPAEFQGQSPPSGQISAEGGILWLSPC